MKDLVISIAKDHGLDEDFVCAIVKVESNWNPSVVRYEPNWKYFVNPKKFAEKNHITEKTETELQKFSWGLTQIMGGKARELGFDDMLTELISPEIALNYSCIFLKNLLDRYKVYEKVAAAYNGGSALYKTGTQEFRNQQYVDKVMENLGG